MFAPITRFWLRLVAFAVLFAPGRQLGAQLLNTPLARPQSIQSFTQPNGDFTAMPQKFAVSRRSGLTLLVDTRWVNGFGYRPVTVTIDSPKAVTLEHQIKIQLHSGWEFEYETSVEQDFELPAGSRQASTVVAMPIYDQSRKVFWWDVWVDGNKDFDLCRKLDEAMRSSSIAAITGTTIRILAPGTAANDRSVVGMTNSDFEVLSFLPQNFPDRWIDYTCLDVVSISLANLEHFATKQPATLEALTRWVRVGGQLWISDVGGNYEKLPDVSKRLGLSDKLITLLPQSLANTKETKPNKAEADKAASEVAAVEIDAADTKVDATGAKDEEASVDSQKPLEDGWRSDRFFRGGSGQAQGFIDNRTGRTRWVSDPRIIAALDQDPNWSRQGFPGTVGNDNMPWFLSPDSSAWFVEQRVGLGVVRAFRGVNDAASIANKTSVVNSAASASGDPIELTPRPLALALRSTRRWNSRHGLIPDSGNSEFARLLVPGVGLAPVTEFEILITLFVLLIGPLNYWLLKRYRRLQLLVLTVPVAALFTTVSLFGYAILSDGFSSTVRIRSYTSIDQRTGEAGCWARMSYYSGFAPGKGLVMPADAVMFPVLPTWANENWGINRALVWNGEKAELTRGWLNSRTPTQYLFQRAGKTSRRIDITTGLNKMQVTNRLGSHIKSLLVLDAKGTFFAGENVDEEARATLQPVSRQEAVNRIVPLVRDNEPDVPIALAGGERDYVGVRIRGLRRGYGGIRPPGGEQLNENQANRAITDLAGLNGRPPLDLPVRSYVAVTEHGPEVETGIPSAKEAASFHVVVGRW